MLGSVCQGKQRRKISGTQIGPRCRVLLGSSLSSSLPILCVCGCVGFFCCFNTCPKPQLAQINLKWTCSCSGPLCMEQVELVRWWSTLTEDLPLWMSVWTCRKPQGSDARRDASSKALTGDLPSRGTPPAYPKDLLALGMCVQYSLESFTCTVTARCHLLAGAGTTLLSLWDLLTGYSWSVLQDSCGTGCGLLPCLNISRQLMAHWLFTYV